MRHQTPFFAAFGPLLFGKAKRSAIEELVSSSTSTRSLSQFQEAFGEFIPQALLAPSEKGVNSRERLFPQHVTFWAFLAQVLERGSTCRNALRRITAWMKWEDPAAPDVSENSAGYCTARARLEESTLQKINTQVANRLERNVQVLRQFPWEPEQGEPV